MKNTGSKSIWGILFVLLGLALAGRAFGIFNFNLFFNGWWTLFIIIPCALGLSEKGHRTSSVIGMGIGILLLLSAQGVFHWYMFWRILVAFIFIVIGCSIMFRGNRERGYHDYNNQSSNGQNVNNSNWNNQNYTYDNTTDYNENSNQEFHYNNCYTDNNSYNNSNNYTDNSSYNNSNSYNENNSYNSNNYNNYNGNYDSNNNYDGNNNGNNGYNGYHDNNSTNNNTNYNSNGSRNYGNYTNITGFLSGRTVQFVDEVFTGAVVTSVLGSVQIDLRNAIFHGNVAIETTCILGGVDIYVPSNVKVVNNCMSILAGVDNKVMNPSNPNGELYTLFINGSCILGGIEVK